MAGTSQLMLELHSHEKNTRPTLLRGRLSPKAGEGCGYHRVGRNISLESKNVNDSMVEPPLQGKLALKTGGARR
jgi:hypothetical protein